MNEEILLLPAASLLEFLGVLTIVTNDSMLMEGVNLGFSVPAVLPVEIQGLGLFFGGASMLIFYVFRGKDQI